MSRTVEIQSPLMTTMHMIFSEIGMGYLIKFDSTQWSEDSYLENGRPEFEFHIDAWNPGVHWPTLEEVAWITKAFAVAAGVHSTSHLNICYGCKNTMDRWTHAEAHKAEVGTYPVLEEPAYSVPIPKLNVDSWASPFKI